MERRLADWNLLRAAHIPFLRGPENPFVRAPAAVRWGHDISRFAHARPHMFQMGVTGRRVHRTDLYYFFP